MSFSAVSSDIAQFDRFLCGVIITVLHSILNLI